METKTIKLTVGIFILLVVVGTIGATLSSSDVKDYIINSFQNTFGIETDPVITNINIEGEKYWNIEYLSYEEGIWTDIQPLNETMLKITINAGEEDWPQGYGWNMAICNLSGVNSLQYLEEGDFEDPYSVPEPLQYEKLIDEGLSEIWCLETNGYGFVLFSGGSKNQLPEHFRLIFPEGEKGIILITGSGSEKVNIIYSGNVAFVNFTASDVGRKNNDTITMVTNVENLK